MKKIALLSVLVLILSIIPFIGKSVNTNASATCMVQDENRAGCCSRHGGVCGCDKSQHRQKCCDGTLSPSCGC